MKRIIAIMVLAGAAANSFAQCQKAIDDLAAQHQACLDEGTHVVQCSRHYFMQMDSMLNVVYKSLCKNLDAPAKESLRRDQLLWLRKRDAYFRLQQQEYQKIYTTGEVGSNTIMEAYDDDAEFIKDRILLLLGRMNSTAVR